MQVFASSFNFFFFFAGKFWEKLQTINRLRRNQVLFFRETLTPLWDRCFTLLFRINRGSRFVGGRLGTAKKNRAIPYYLFWSSSHCCCIQRFLCLVNRFSIPKWDKRNVWVIICSLRFVVVVVWELGISHLNSKKKSAGVKKGAICGESSLRIFFVSHLCHFFWARSRFHVFCPHSAFFLGANNTLLCLLFFRLPFLL